MLRVTQMMRLRRTNTVTGISSTAAAACGMKPPAVGPKGAVPPVCFRAASCPMAATIDTVDGRKVSVAKAVADMTQALNRACAAKNTDRGVVSAPALGYNARILVVHSGMDRRALINPVVTITSHQTIHAWTPEGDEVYRVQRHRSVAVKYTTADGDDETWYAMPLEESEAVQRHLDVFDGFGVGDRVSPLVGDGVPSAFVEAAEDVRQVVCHGVVPREMFKAHEGLLMRLVEAVPRSALAECA